MTEIRVPPAVSLTPVENGHHRFTFALPAVLRGQWCELRIPEIHRDNSTLLCLRFDPQAVPHDPWAAAILTYGRGGATSSVFNVPDDVAVLHIDLFGLWSPAPVQAVVSKISRATASFKLMAHSPARALDLFKRGSGMPARRLRSLLIGLAAGMPRWLDYTTWHRVFDSWSDTDRQALFASPDRATWPSIGVVVDRAGAGQAAIRATDISLERQWWGAAGMPVEARPIATLADILSERREDYIAVIQAGEIVPPHALAVFADQAAKAGYPAAVYADEDELGIDLQRKNPHFKPDAGKLLLASGLLTRGMWLFRRDVLTTYGDMKMDSASMLRLALALRLTDGGEQAGILHVPFVLTHRRFDCVTEQGETLARLAEEFLHGLDFSAAIDAQSVPLRIRPRIGDGQSPAKVAKVSLIIPSTARAPHVAACLDGVLRHTHYPDFEIIIVVSQADPLDAAQEALLSPLRARADVRVVWLATPTFSFARATNVGVAAAEGALICLVNDDVVPLQDDWLWVLVGHLQDREVGIVGPKLLYPDGTVQHGGVIMGLGGGCAHAHRLLPGEAPGYMFRACLDQDLCSVTGACLLVRRTVYEALGGLDETYPIAFNDIDFCLRAREARWRVIYAASATLTHYETVSLGSHYEGERGGLQVPELDRLLTRWAGVVAADPFHNPNLSLQMDHEWDTELPPRITKPFGCRRADMHAR